ncbi:MAG: hypothetical protein H7A47_11730 [Verrucomicrobiales bacterium]|nr:hypothetical protein [Verrucomicrobiales bacterium]
MTEFIKLQTPEKTIQIGFTDQKVSGRAGLLTFAGFLHWHRFGALLALVLPHRRTSKKAIPVADLALGFLAGILAGAQKRPTGSSAQRRDAACAAGHPTHRQPVHLYPLLPGLHSREEPPPSVPLALVPGAAAQSPRRLQPGPDSDPAPARGRATRRAWPATPAWAPNQPASAGGGAEEVKLVVGFLVATGQRQLRQQRGRLHPGNCCAAAWRIAIGLVRADSGFCPPEWLNLLGGPAASHIVVARLLKPVQRLLKKDLIWQASSVPGTEVAEVWHQKPTGPPLPPDPAAPPVAESERPGNGPAASC